MNTIQAEDIKPRRFTCFTYTGAPSFMPLDDKYSFEMKCPAIETGCMDAPDFLPQGYHFNTWDGYITQAHTIRKGAFVSSKGGAA